MKLVRGVSRVLITLWVLFVGSLVSLALLCIPVRVRGARLSAWPATYVSRFLLFLYGIKAACQDTEQLRQHAGMVFPNHLSYVDILMMLQIMPMRFVSTHWVRPMPFVGWFAIGMDTIFVNRQNRDSRKEARGELTEQMAVRRIPPVVVFPEGGISPANGIGPFRYGAFEVAVEGAIPYLPCAIVYDNPRVIAWREESFVVAFWRLATFSERIHARVVPLNVKLPRPGDDPKRMADEARTWIIDMVTRYGIGLEAL